MTPSRPIHTLALGLALAAGLGACATQRLEQAITKPEQGMSPAAEAAGIQKIFCTPVEYATLGPGPERLAYAVVPPRDYGASLTVNMQTPNHGEIKAKLPEHCPGPADHPVASRGTVVLLHGYLGSMVSQWPWAARFAKEGYTAVMVDLPGFGASTDYPPDYGAASAERVAQLVSRLRAGNRLPGPLFLMGTSLGGMEALRLAALVPDARGTLALAPFRDFEASAWSLVGSDAPAWVRWMVSREDLHAAMRSAETQLHAPLLDQHPEDAVGASHACTVLLRGTADPVVTEADVAAYAARLPRAQVVPLPKLEHDAPGFRLDWLPAPILGWFSAVADAPPGACPPFVLPPDPCCQNAPNPAAG